MSRRRRWTIVLVLCAGMVGGLYAGRDSLLPAMGRWLDVGELPPQSDYVMVLGGDEETRPFVAAALVKAGFARKALVSKIVRTPGDEEGLSPPLEEVIRGVLIYRGVPPDGIIVIDHLSATTFDETQALAEFLESVPGCRVTVVTSHFHTRRTRWVMSRVLGETAARVSLVSAPSDDFALDRWWQNERGFELVTNEYLKLAFYWVRYNLLQAGAVAGLVLLATIAVVYRRRRLAKVETVDSRGD